MLENEKEISENIQVLRVDLDFFWSRSLIT